jgi:hypothetical protein
MIILILELLKLNELAVLEDRLASSESRTGSKSHITASTNATAFPLSGLDSASVPQHLCILFLCQSHLDVPAVSSRINAIENWFTGRERTYSLPVDRLAALMTPPPATADKAV